MKVRTMKCLRRFVVCLVGSMAALMLLGRFTAVAVAQTMLVNEGRAAAVIVTAPNPPRMVNLAAKELQTYLNKITGATLPILTSPPTDADTVAIYVGRSDATDRLGIKDEGLIDGAYRIVSGDKWLALVGRDRDFVPIEPWAIHHGDLSRMLSEWDKITGHTWGNPYGDSIHRNFNKQMNLWAYDERGSLNAVYAFLRDQGVRWYMPGELGEIVPKVTSVALPKVNRTVKPDFGLRYFHFAFFSFACTDDILWSLRLGLNTHSTAVGDALMMAHGMAYVHERKEFIEAHPDYYALIGGKRQTQDGGKPCMSSKGLFEENVLYLRRMFDHYQLPMGSVFPADGFGSMCQCPLCDGKATLQRGREGSMSDYVWEYANRVATELYKTHPDRPIACFAYGTYLLPPEKIDKLSPNLVVGIVQPRRMFNDPKTRERFEEIRRAWLTKVSTAKFIIWDHYPFTAPGRPSYGIPQYFPHLIATDLRSLKDKSFGEIVEVMFDDKRDMALHAPAFNHLNLYVTATGYWNAQQDVDALLAEYYTSFYGPAAVKMREFVDFCESAGEKLRSDAPAMDRALSLAQQARDAAPDGSPYQRRLDLLMRYLQPMKELKNQLAIGRKDVPEARIPPVVVADKDIQIDGKLDEPAWEEARPGYGLFGLSDVTTGARPAQRTTFRAFWAGDSLYLGIRCEDSDSKALNIGTKQSRDQALWNGDCVEVLLETPQHSYYQIAVNPAGAQFDADRISGINDQWASQAHVASHIGDGFWSVEMRIPIADARSGQLDPLHQVVGEKPTSLHPWFFNVCRQRIRGSQVELTTYSPTGKLSFHELMRFAKLYVH